MKNFTADHLTILKLIRKYKPDFLDLVYLANLPIDEVSDIVDDLVTWKLTFRALTVDGDLLYFPTTYGCLVQAGKKEVKP